MINGNLKINDQSWSVRRPDDLTRLSTAIARQEMLDVWLERSDGNILSGLVNPVRGFLIYMTPDHPEGWHSLAPAYLENELQLDKFRLANGQVDEHPVDWCLARAELSALFLKFWETGERPTPPDWAYDGTG